jgi:2-C-methyl-D-erythritol 4-phosphate cytidylyltransferase/2-C-methyl-D-erythritol 2,4-cyclodiphosphate synthase
VSDAILGAPENPISGSLPGIRYVVQRRGQHDLRHRVVSLVRSRVVHTLDFDIVLSAQYPALSVSEEIQDKSGAKPFAEEHEKTVNLKVKSGEGIGPIGAGPCMECSAVATIERISERNCVAFGHLMMFRKWRRLSPLFFYVCVAKEWSGGFPD